MTAVARISVARWPGAAVGIAAAMAQPLLIKALRVIWPGVVFSVKTKQRVVALTIDDGPSSVTDELRTLLSGRGARATFFLIGENAQVGPDKQLHPALAQLHAAGHEVANHTWKDQSMFWWAADDIERDLRQTHDLLRFADVRLFRPGGGKFRPRMLKAARKVQRDYECVLASVYPHDPRVPFDRFVVWYVGWLARPGAIIVLHEGEGDRVRVVKLLERVLERLEARRYRVTTVSELLALRSH